MVLGLGACDGAAGLFTQETVELEPTPSRSTGSTDASRIRVLHLSDLHLPTDRNSPEVQALAHFVGSLTPKPAAIAISGDFVDSPTDRASFAVASELLTGFSDGGRCIIVACPGNHDVRMLGNFGQCDRQYQNAIGTWSKPQIVSNQVLLYPIDSTQEGGSARGGFANSELTKLTQYLDKPEARAALVRVAIVHHHALPVTSANRDPTEIWREPLLMMSNPGVLLETLFREGFSLMLHGHHHVPSHWEMSHVVDNSRRALAVIGCGSSTQGTRPSAVVLDIAPGRSIAMSRYARVDLRYVQEGASQPALDPNVFAQQTRKRHEVGKSPSVKRVVRWGDFTNEGDLLYEHLLSGICFPRPISYLPLEISSDVGVFGPPQLRSSERGISPSARESESGNQCLTLKVEFAPDAPVNVDFDLGLSGHVSNAFAITREERLLHSRNPRIRVRSDQFDYFGWKVDTNADELQLVLRVPDAEYLREVHADVRDSLDQPVPEDSRALKQCLSILDASRSVCLHVRNPVFGYSYQIGWRVPSAATLGRPVTSPLVERCRQDLRANGRVLLSGLTECWRGLSRSLGGSLDVGVMVADDSLGRLQHVANTDATNMSLQELAIGEGVAGRSHKLEAVTYWSIRVDETSPVRSWYKRCRDGPQHQALLSLPFYIRSDPRGGVAAIVTFGTIDSGSELCMYAHQEIDDALLSQLYEAGGKALEGAAPEFEFVAGEE